MARTASLVSLLALLIGRPLAAEGPATEKKTTSARVLPGLQRGGQILLPNQWSLRPAGKEIALGDFPVNMALHPSGKWLAVLHCGYGEHEVATVDLKTEKIVARVSVDNAFYGLAFAPDGKTLFASGGEFEVIHSFAFEDGLLSKHRQLPVAKVADTFIVAGLTTDAAGKTLYVAGPWGHKVAIVPVADPEQREVISLEKDSYPYTCVLAPGGKRLFVSLWNKAAVAVIDLDAKKV